MKRVLIGLFALVCLAGATAQDIAVGPIIVWDVVTQKVADTSTTTTDELLIGATVPIVLRGGLEVAPELLLILDSDSDTTGFSFGAGLYWALNKAGVFQLKTGPKLMLTMYSEYNNVSKSDDENFGRFGMAISVPLIADLAVSKMFTLRLVQPVVTLNWSTNSYTNVLTQKVVNSAFSFDTFYSGFLPTFIFLFKF